MNNNIVLLILPKIFFMIQRWKIWNFYPKLELFDTQSEKITIFFRNMVFIEQVYTHTWLRFRKLAKWSKVLHLIPVSGFNFCSVTHTLLNRCSGLIRFKRNNISLFSNVLQVLRLTFYHLIL